MRDDAAVASFPLLICDCAGISVSPLVVSARQWPDGSPHSWHRQLIELSLLPRTSASCIHHSVHYRVCPLSIVAASSRSKSDTFSHNHIGILILSWSRSSSFATTSVASLRYVCLHEYVHAYVITIRSKQEREKCSVAVRHGIEIDNINLSSLLGPSVGAVVVGAVQLLSSVAIQLKSDPSLQNVSEY